MTTAQLIQTADQMMIDHQFFEAKDILVDALEKDPQNPEVYYLMGDVLCKLQRFDEAVTMLLYADKLLPKNPRICNLLGWALFMNEQIDEGRTFMEVASKMEPSNEQTYANLAVLELRANRFRKAKEYVNRGLKVAPNDPMLKLVAGLVDRMIDAQKKSWLIKAKFRLTQSIKCFSKSHHLKPSFHLGLINPRLQPIVTQQLAHLHNL